MRPADDPLNITPGQGNHPLTTENPIGSSFFSGKMRSNDPEPEAFPSRKSRFKDRLYSIAEDFGS